MTRKDKIEAVDRYLSGELAGNALSEFNAELAADPGLAEETRLQMEIQEAVMETGIAALRESLQNVAKQAKAAENMPDMGHEEAFSFELSEEMSSFKEFSQPVSLNDILGFRQCLPKVHLFQHNIASRENIHQFYKEQQETGAASAEEHAMGIDGEEIFAGVQAALEENDIQDLRANLQQIAASVPAHQRDGQEIDEYINNGLSGQQLAAFEQELAMGGSLAKDVELYRDADLAAAEADIMGLRESLQAIHRAGESTSQKMEGLDRYLSGELEGESLYAFEEELSNSPLLAAELALFEEVDRAVGETEVMALREKLGAIGREAARQEKQKRSFAARARSPRVALATIAASLVLLLGIAGLMGGGGQASDAELYQQHYSPYGTTGTFRSGDALVDAKLTRALAKYNEKEYHTAIALFNEVLQVDKGNPVGNFYSGMAYHETGQLDMALEAYQNVARDRDNLFVEQAQWYTGLCLLQANDRKKAYQQFKRIANSGSFYQEKALAILRKMEYPE